MSTDRLDLIGLLAVRLERLSADSLWARRASGTRGSLLKALEAAEHGLNLPPDELDSLIQRSFELLENAAREIPDPGARHAPQPPAWDGRPPGPEFESLKLSVRKTYAQRL